MVRILLQVKSSELTTTRHHPVSSCSSGRIYRSGARNLSHKPFRNSIAVHPGPTSGGQVRTPRAARRRSLLPVWAPLRDRRSFEYLQESRFETRLVSILANITEEARTPRRRIHFTRVENERSVSGDRDPMSCLGCHRATHVIQANGSCHGLGRLLIKQNRFRGARWVRRNVVNRARES